MWESVTEEDWLCCIQIANVTNETHDGTFRDTNDCLLMHQAWVACCYGRHSSQFFICFFMIKHLYAKKTRPSVLKRNWNKKNHLMLLQVLAQRQWFPITSELTLKIYGVLGRAVRNHYETWNTTGPQEPFNAHKEEMPSKAPSKRNQQESPQRLRT